MSSIKKPSKAAELLRKAIESRGITYEDAAWLIGVDKTTLFRWLRGEYCPTHEQACKIEDMLGIYHRYWLSGSPATDKS
jgi:ribosome-binding protein aMBF1 (putative translation factor)